MRILLKIIKFAAIVSVIAAASLITYDYLKTYEAFPPKTFISFVNVSSLTPQEAITKLREVPFNQFFAPLVTIEVEDAHYSFPPEKLGIYIKYKETIKRAFEETHKDNYFKALIERIDKEVSTSPVILGVSEEYLRTVLEVFASKLRSPVKDASITFNEKTRRHHIHPEAIGKEVNIAKSMAAFNSVLSKKETNVPLVIDYIYPLIREKPLREHPPVYRISSYTTYYGQHDSKNRIHNIKLIASWIDGLLLMSGEAFSLQESVGEFIPGRGFKEAFVIYDGELVPELGGGTCQIGTTLYNAVSLAELKVLQRRNHSFYFNIYPLGRDATLYPEQADFKFENDSGYPILIKATATNTKLSIRLYGTPSGKKVRFSKPAIYGRNQSGRYVPMTLKEVTELDIPFKTIITRTVYDKNWKKIKEELIRSSYKLYGDKENVPRRRPEPG